MSGPKTAVIATPDPCFSILAAIAIQAAVSVAAGYREAAAQNAAHAAARAEDHAQQVAATEAGNRALEARISSAERRFAHLAELAQELSLNESVAALRPLRPADADQPTLAAYCSGFEGVLDEIESALRTEAARRQHTFAQPTTINVDAASTTSLAEPSTAQRLLARIAHLGTPPANIAALARELDDTPPGTRAELLATELRKAIQEWVEAIQATKLREAQAIIIEQTLKDLGYAVEGIEHTLFVEGGVAHFQRSGWGDYMVRLRVGAGGNSVNFNVVRAVSEGENARSALDHLAEDRWCAEFPALLKALEARGLVLTVTRHLEAGELPVQAVDRCRLPEFAREEALLTARRPLARQQPIH